MSPDWECFLRAQRGDSTAWRALVDQHQSRLGALALFITGSVVSAEDIVQETFVRAFRARTRHTTGTVGGFLGTIAYRLAVKEAKRLRRNVPLEGVDVPDSDPDPLEHVLDDERDRLIVQAIGTLTDGHRDVLVLRFYGGHSYEEIAELLQLPLGTVKSRVFYAAKSCRDVLKKKGVLA